MIRLMIQSQSNTGRHYLFTLIAVCLVLILAIVAWYLLLYLPRLDRRNVLLAQGEKCRNAGEKYHGEDQWKKWDEEVGSTVGLMHAPFEFTFSQKLNTCLGYQEITKNDFTGSIFEKRITDIYKNKTLFIYLPGCSHADCISEADFDKQKNELFKGE